MATLMTDKDFAALINKKSTKVVKIPTKDTSSVYVVQVEVGDMPREQVLNHCRKLKEKLEEYVGEKFIIAPTSFGKGSLKFAELEFVEVK